MNQDYFELRLYQCAPGRLQDLHHRMSREVPPLFARNGVVRPIAYWEAFGGPMTPLYAYMLRWQNLDERMAAFGRFYADPGWHKCRAESAAGREMVERIHVFFLRASPAWERLADPAGTGPVGGLHELRFLHVRGSDLARATAAIGEVELPFLQRRGATVLGVFNTWIGTRLPQLSTLVAWPTPEARSKALHELDADPEVARLRAVERQLLGRPTFTGGETYLMRPAPYGTAQANLAPLP